MHLSSKLNFTVPLVIALVFLSACTISPYRSADFNNTDSDDQAHKIGQEYAKNATLAVQVTEEHVDRPYRVIGNINAYARAIFPWSVDPSVDDVNKKMNKEAVARGADAVMDVDYRTEKTVFSDHGIMLGFGVAIVYLK